MKLIKGFVTSDKFIDNSKDTISPILELHTWGRTYSKEIGEYNDPNHPDYTLLTFLCIDGETAEHQMISGTETEYIIKLVRDVIGYSEEHIYPFDDDEFRGYILSRFYPNITNVNYGEFDLRTTLKIPSWISWNILDDAGEITHEIKIWLTNDAFDSQYDEYEIYVVPPLKNVDDFFNGYSFALDQINKTTITDISNRITETKGNDPESYIRMYEFDYVNATDNTIRNKTTWSVIIYGKAGDNVDSIKDAIVDYVLKNSKYTQEQWEKIFPDIFKRTEFLFVPMWQEMSIENLSVQSGLYASMLNVSDSVNFVREFLTQYTPSFLNNELVIMPYDYKAITLFSLPGENNKEEAARLRDLYPDYIPVPSTSNDFNRMVENTRDFVLLLGELLIQAESIGKYNSIPGNMRRQYRNGAMYISAMKDNVNYLVACKMNEVFNVSE